MDRSTGNRMRLHRGGGVAVTHRFTALASPAASENYDAPPTFGSSPSYLHSSQPTIPRCTAATSHGPSHAPAVWLFASSDPPREKDQVTLAAASVEGDMKNNEGDDGEEDTQPRLESERRARCARPGYLPQLRQPWIVSSIELGSAADSGMVEAPSPRVLDNRLHFFDPHSISVESQRSLSLRSAEEETAAAAAGFSATCIPSHATAVRVPPVEMAADRFSASTNSYAASVTDTPIQTWVSAANTAVSHQPQRRSTLPVQPVLSSTHRPPPSATSSSSIAAADGHHRAQAAPTSLPRSADSAPSLCSSSSSSASSMSSCSAAKSSHGRAAKKEGRVGGAQSANTHTASLPPITTASVDGLGPLLVVHLDVLPDLRYLGTESTSVPVGKQQSNVGSRNDEGDASTDAGTNANVPRGAENGALVVHANRDDAILRSDPQGLMAASSSPPYHKDYYNKKNAAARAVNELVAREAHETHTREVAALYAQLEVAEQRVRIAEQQVIATAELRAAELMKDYKSDERRRRAQFQASLDTLREENRTLTAQLEAAVRAPAMGLHPSTAATVSLVTHNPSTATARADGALSTVISEADVARQVQSVEAYWRDRLRNAERHWEDEMAQQIRQRREALDQVDELVRTVEQMQEELRYTRRQTARLREENARLSSSSALAARATMSSHNGPTAVQIPSAAVSAEEVARLRHALAEHEHREAALLAQVESYGEEASQVRLRCEAALERAQQDLAAERRRSTEMVKLYGSQLESLHHQLREAKRAGVSQKLFDGEEK